MNNGGVLEFVVEDVDEHFENIIIEQTEGAVHQHPGRGLQQYACDGKTQLFILTEFAIPTLRGIEQGRQSFEA